MRCLAKLRGFAADDSGLAAIEMSLVALLLAAALINAVEIGRYAVSIMQVDNAAQMGVSAAYGTCDTEHVPATINCPDLNAAVDTAVTSTSLGTGITRGGTYSEGWYCVNASNVLQLVATYASPKPADCSSIGKPSASPGLYLGVEATYPFQPMFPGMTLAATFTSPIRRTAWVRMQ
jgi:Flp pilus assembly protein TadG